MRKFYRVCNTSTQQGLWYDFNGDFTGFIHNKFNFCKNTTLPMEFDSELTGYLSATTDLISLYRWFSKEDIIKLQEFGWYIHVYESDDAFYYEKSGHWVFSQTNCTFVDVITLKPTESDR